MKIIKIKTAKKDTNNLLPEGSLFRVLYTTSFGSYIVKYNGKIIAVTGKGCKSASIFEYMLYKLKNIISK